MCPTAHRRAGRRPGRPAGPSWPPTGATPPDRRRPVGVSCQWSAGAGPPQPGLRRIRGTGTWHVNSHLELVARSVQVFTDPGQLELLGCCGVGIRGSGWATRRSPPRPAPTRTRRPSPMVRGLGCWRTQHVSVARLPPYSRTRRSLWDGAQLTDAPEPRNCRSDPRIGTPPGLTGPATSSEVPHGCTIASAGARRRRRGG